MMNHIIFISIIAGYVLLLTQYQTKQKNETLSSDQRSAFDSSLNFFRRNQNAIGNIPNVSIMRKAKSLDFEFQLNQEAKRSSRSRIFNLNLMKSEKIKPLEDMSYKKRYHQNFRFEKKSNNIREEKKLFDGVRDQSHKFVNIRRVLSERRINDFRNENQRRVNQVRDLTQKNSANVRDNQRTINKIFDINRERLNEIRESQQRRINEVRDLIQERVSEVRSENQRQVNDVRSLDEQRFREQRPRRENQVRSFNERRVLNIRDQNERQIIDAKNLNQNQLSDVRNQKQRRVNQFREQNQRVNEVRELSQKRIVVKSQTQQTELNSDKNERNNLNREQLLIDVNRYVNVRDSNYNQKEKHSFRLVKKNDDEKETRRDAITDQSRSDSNNGRRNNQIKYGTLEYPLNFVGKQEDVQNEWSKKISITNIVGLITIYLMLNTKQGRKRIKSFTQYITI